MGQSHSCNTGKQLLAACHDGNTGVVRAILQQSPSTSCYTTCLERNTPLLIAAAKGHARMVQAILEAAVLSQGVSRAKKRCINHSNSKGQSALMMACTNGHAQVVELLVCNGASPLLLDNARHNSALHWAASCCRADCVSKLLGTGATFQMQSGQLVAIADIPCFDEDNATLVKFIDRHNGLGLTALHLAVHKGSSSTARALLRHGASISSRSTEPSLAISPAVQPPGSTVLHFAAAAEDVTLVLVLLEVQVGQNGPDLRRAVNAQNQRPIDLARSSSNHILLQLLEPSNPISLHPGPRPGVVLNPGSNLSRVITREGLRQQQNLLGLASGAAYRGGRRGQSDPKPHIALTMLLQRLKLVLSLEVLQLQLATGAASSATSQAEVVNDSLQGRKQPAQASLLRASDLVDERNVDDQDGGGVARSGLFSAAARPPSLSGEAAGVCPVLHGSSTHGTTANPCEICPALSSSQGPTTAAKEDPGVATGAGHDLQHPSTTQRAAQHMRLQMLLQLSSMVEGLLAMLPAPATAVVESPAASSSSPANTGTGQQHSQGAGSVLARSSSSSSVGTLGGSQTGSFGHWGLLGSLLTRSSTDPPHNTSGPQQQQERRLFGLLRSSSRHSRSRAGQPTANTTSGPNSSSTAPMSEAILTAYITPSMMCSLAAVIKLFAGASPLLGQQGQLGGSSLLTSSHWVMHSCWAEQEHSLVIMKGILQTIHNSLVGAKQAAAAAASRTALRQRHQQQMANLLGEDRDVHSHALRRALLRERAIDQGLSRSSTSLIGHSSRPDFVPFPAGFGSVGLGWGVEGSVGAAPRDAAAHSSRHVPRRHPVRRSHHGDPPGGPEGAHEATPRRHRHHSQHHRSSRRRVPRAVDLVVGEQERSAPASLATTSATAQLRQNLHSSSSNNTPFSSGSHVLPLSSTSPVHAASDAGQSTVLPRAASVEQQQQRHLQQLVCILSKHRIPAGQARQQRDDSCGTNGPCVDLHHSTSPASAAVNSGSTLASSPTARQYDATADATPQHAVASAVTASDSSTGSSSSSSSGSDSEQQEDAARLEKPQGLSQAARAAVCPENFTCEATAAAATAASLCSSADGTTCAICMDSSVCIAVSSCAHSLCLQCAYQLCCKAKGVPLCPFCRQAINGFDVCDSSTCAPAH